MAMAAGGFQCSLPKSVNDCGHFHLRLQMFEKNMDRTINNRYESINDQMEGGSIQYSQWNVLGVMLYQLGKKLDACGYFEKVLEEDPCNLNAMANMLYVYKHMGLAKKSQVYSNGLHAFFRRESDLSAEERQCALVRCLAEQAFAMAFDCYDERQESPPLNEEATCRFELAIEESKRFTTLDEERCKWKFFMAVTLMRVIERSKHDQDFNQIKDDVNKALLLLQDVLDETSDESCQAQSWCYVARLLLMSKQCDASPSYIDHLNENLRECYTDPIKCIQKAESLNGCSWKELTKIAGFLLQLEKYDDGLHLVKSSLQKNPDKKTNWNAYHLKASFCLELFDEKFRTSSERDESLLKEAENALESLTGMAHRSAYKLLAARVQLHIGAVYIPFTTDFPSRVKNKEAIMKALELMSSDGDTHPSKLKVHGNCFMFLGEYAEASDKYIQCLNNGGSSYILFVAEVSLFHQLRQLQSTEQKSQVMTQICDVFKQYCCKFKKCDVLKSLRSIGRDFPSEFEEVNLTMREKTGRSLKELL